MREANDNGLDCLILNNVTATSEAYLHINATKSVKAKGGIFGAVPTFRDLLYAINGSPAREPSEPFWDVSGRALPANPHLLDPDRIEMPSDNHISPGS
jgi:hypothetical protein